MAGPSLAAMNVQVNFFAGAVRARLRPDAYLEQVRRIAPPWLLGRDRELAELARFCLGTDAAPYVWWQAGPWAGKSAPLSTLVLHPPSGVRIVSFFITARLAAQDTREAFTQVLLEQLAALLGQSLPAVLPESICDAYLRDHIAPILDGVRSPRMGRKPAHWTDIDPDYETLRIGMQTLFRDLAIETHLAA
jgi:hypothetical protein